MNTPVQNKLLALARESIESYIKGQDLIASPPGNQMNEAIEGGGVFVTLTKGGELRGCIGMIVSSAPRWETVIRMARDAAFEDPRFPPLTEGELKEIRIEISLLTPPQSLEDWKSIQLGRDGIILAKNGRRALFLPQVAEEQGWDLETTLWHLSRKAGLHPDAWKESDCRFEIFQASHFQEEIQ